MNLNDRLPTTAVYDAYWRFAYERQQVFHRRIAGHPPDWTADDVLRRYKFTNAYRASDRVSQYLIRNVIYSGDYDTDDTCLRILLFKFFNRIDTWELLEQEFGEVSKETFDSSAFKRVLERATNAGGKLYSAAYIIPTPPRGSHLRKYEFHIDLVQRMLREHLPERVSQANSMEQVFNLLLSYPTVGPFLAYQYAIDINYSEVTSFSENDFVRAGPGALDGIRRCFVDTGEYTPEEIIRLVTEHQASEFERLGLKFEGLWGRQLHLIDCQNLFCEISKYARVAFPQDGDKRRRIKQTFVPESMPIEYWYPPKWGLNEHIE
ncbi:MAG: hypothetical protein GKR94_16070 [Gammaproteobacteria bacterium]|nr:hypothetical protein [Gammaproteobacteria bacterium]